MNRATERRLNGSALAASGFGLMLDETQIEFLEWLEEQDGYYVRDDVVAERFPDLEFRMVGVTKMVNDDGSASTPIRDWRQAVKYGRVTD